MVEKVKQIMEELPPDSGQQLLALCERLPGNLKLGKQRTPLDQLRFLLITISEKWEHYTAFFYDPGILWTKNLTEQAIGRMKTRAKTIRGYKTQSGMLNGLLVPSSRLT